MILKDFYALPMLEIDGDDSDSNIMNRILEYQRQLVREHREKQARIHQEEEELKQIDKMVDKAVGKTLDNVFLNLLK